jgi:hypothetical protein
MATLVSVVAVIAFAGISSVLADQWVETVSRASFDEIQATKLEGDGSAHAYIFSFGLENAYGSPVNPTGANKSTNRVAH